MTFAHSPALRTDRRTRRTGLAFAAALLMPTLWVSVGAASVPSVEAVTPDCVAGFASPYLTTQDCVVPAGVFSMAMYAIGGGGGGGVGVSGGAGGGGGGGQVSICGVVPVTPGDTITITIGAGGTGGTTAAAATDGGITRFDTAATSATKTPLCGAWGGEAGASNGGSSGGAVVGGVGPNNGAATSTGGGGGGGAGGPGYDADGSNGGGGGMGMEGGGAGGGGGGSVGGAPGLGSDGGGNGSTDTACATSPDGTANSGSGGGGGVHGVCAGGSGGSGIALLQFTVAQECTDGATGYIYDFMADTPGSVSCLVPDGATSVDILVVGGGGGGGYADTVTGSVGGGGGGGAVKVCSGVEVTGGDLLDLSIGMGGSGGSKDIGGTYAAQPGSGSLVMSDAVTLCDALGGSAGKDADDASAPGGGGTSGSSQAGGAAQVDAGIVTAGGGGGGDSAAGAAGSGLCGGAGGDGQTVSALASPGLFSDLTDSFGGGGGGGSTSTCAGGFGGLGGSGGGGDGQPAATWGDQLAADNSGGGGGGGSSTYCAPGGSPCGNGGGGAHGYVELRFTMAPPDCVSAVGHTTVGFGYCTVPAGVTSIDALVVGAGAGGGYGGGDVGGGGGGGWVLVCTLDVTPGEVIEYYVGVGGAGATDILEAYNGENSFISGYDCDATSGLAGLSTTSLQQVTAAGGSSGNAYLGTPFPGGTFGRRDTANNIEAGGGGGGASAAGAAAVDCAAGAGGAGQMVSALAAPGRFELVDDVYGGGGGGGASTGDCTTPTAGAGGVGGGGAGGKDASGTDGVANTGGGGGGGGASGGVGGNGGKGGDGYIELRFEAAPECVNAVGYTTVGDGSCIVPDGVTSMDVLLVGGGGGGGWGDNDSGGGGGGGEVLVCTISVTPGDVISYTVGTGGAGGDGSDVDGSPLVDGIAGGESRSGECIAQGGSGGTGSDFPMYESPTAAGLGGASGNGNSGGLYGQVGDWPCGDTCYYVETAGGGGGAGGDGADASDCVAGDGGDGQVVNALASPGLFDDVTTAYGGGGGGGVCAYCDGTNGPTGGSGADGGGNGGGDGAPGTANSGGGGGGGGLNLDETAGAGGDGGSGYVEIRFIEPVSGIATTTTTQVSDTSILEDETVSDTATITATADATIGDPTGTVQWYYCYDSTTAPTSCDETTGTSIGDPIDVVEGTADDGIVTAEFADWSPIDGVGYYMFFAQYSGDDNYDASGDDGTNESFEVTAAERLHVCVDKLYVTYGASYYTPKVYYCVPEPTCPTIGSVEVTSTTEGILSHNDCDEDDLLDPTDDSTDGYSTIVDGEVVESGQVGDLPDPPLTDTEGIIDTPIEPMHYEHGIPDGWRKVNPSEYPDTTPPTCDSDYEQGDGVAMSPMPITCTGGDDGPYMFDYEFVTEMYIHPAVLTVRPRHLHLQYGDPEPSPYEYTIKGFKLGETADVLFTLPTCDSDYTPSADAGSRFDITCSGGDAVDGDDDNYTFKYQRSHVHVDRRRVDLRIPDRVVKYGDPAPMYVWSVSGLLEADATADLSQMKGFVAPLCGAAYAPGTSAGTYPIDCIGGGSTNYEFVVQRGTLTVQKAALQVTPGNATVVYGGSSPAAPVTVTGFLNGDTTTTAAGFRAPRCSAPGYTTATNAGAVLPITCTGGSSTNYTFEQVGSSTLTVTKAAAVVKANAKTVTYGSAPSAYGYTVTGLLNGQTTSTIDGLTAPSCTSTYTAATAVGAAPVITCAGASSTNYTFTYVASKVTVVKATLTVTPNNLSIVKGSAVPAYTFTASGFPNGTGPVGSYTAPKCTSKYTTRSPIGSYAITCSGGSATNYAFIYRTATLAVR